MIKLILSDLDDTLIRYGRPSITEYALKAIHAAQDAGVHFGPCTGRIHRDLAWMFAGDERAYETGVNVNGQLVYLDGDVICEKKLDTDALDRVAQAMVRGFEHSALVLTDIATGESIAIGISEAEVEAHRDAFHRVKKVCEHVPDGSWIKANVHIAGSRALAEKARTLVTELAPEFDFIFPNPRGSLFDVMPHGWTKASGAETLREALGITREEVCVFGDAENDLSVMRAYPNAVAVSNAATRVSDFARWHIGSTKDDAVADAIFDIAWAAGEHTMPAFMSPVDNLSALGFRVSGSKGLEGMK